MNAIKELTAYIGTVYIWSEDGTYSHREDVDLRGPLPRRSTLTAPPEPDGDRVAQWAGGVWVLADPPARYTLGVPASAVDAERDRRISAGFEFQGVRYQSRLPTANHPGDWDVFSGKALEAFIAVMNGAQPGDLRWSDPGADFAWIAADNSRVPMDAQTVIELCKAASVHRSKNTFAGSDLKAMQPIPQDYTDDKWWPTA